MGVNNDGEYVGIESDFLLLKLGYGTRDDWELHLRNLVSSRFKDGAAVNNYVETNFVEIEQKVIARLHVQGRRQLSFLKKDAGFALYCRQGNRTVEVKIDEIEELLELRRAEA